MQQIIELIVIITPKSCGQKVINILSQEKIDLQLMCLGKGTAGNAFADYFDTGEPDKKVFFALIEKDKTQQLLSTLDKELNTNKNRTIMFSLSLKSAMYSVIEQMGLVKLTKQPTLVSRIKKLGEKIKNKRSKK